MKESAFGSLFIISNERREESLSVVIWQVRVYSVFLAVFLLKKVWHRFRSKNSAFLGKRRKKNYIINLKIKRNIISE